MAKWVSGCSGGASMLLSSMGEEKTEAKRSSKLVAPGESGESAEKAVSSRDAPGESMARQTSGLGCMPLSEVVPAVLGGVRAGVV